MEHFSQCTCVYSYLGNIINEEIIFLIDEYVHRSEYVETAIAAALFDEYRNLKTGEIKPPQTEIVQRLKLYNGVTKLWHFGGDENCVASILIDGISIATKVPLSGNAAVCTISLGPNSAVEVRVNNILLNQFFDLTWDGPGLTPFSRRRRRYIKSAVTVHDIYDPGQKNDPVDVMCNVACATGLGSTAATARTMHCRGRSKPKPLAPTTFSPTTMTMRSRKCIGVMTDFIGRIERPRQYIVRASILLTICWRGRTQLCFFLKHTVRRCIVLRYRRSL